MKARIMMIIMAAALVALPTMAQQEWQSTSAMQGSGSAYSAQVTAVGATGVTDMASTTTSTPNNGPRRAKKDGDFGPGGKDGGEQDPNSPIGDAWPLALFAALFAIVITIKKHKKAMMKKNIKTILFIAATLVMSGNAWGDTTFPAGTYIFDVKTNFSAGACKAINLFQPYDIRTNYIADIDNSITCNTGVRQQSGKMNYDANGSDMEYVVLTISSEFTASGTAEFMQVKIGNNWYPSGQWTKFGNWTIPTIAGHSGVYLCVVNADGTFSWSNDASLIPSCFGSDPVLSFGAGANGSITTQTVNGERASSGTAYESGSIVELTATPTTPGYVFSCWTNSSSEVVSTSATYSFRLTSSVSLTANFVIEGTDSPISGCAGCFRVAP